MKFKGIKGTWLVIQTNLAQYPTEPMLKVIEAEDYDDLIDKVNWEERNDMSITAIPLDKAKQFLELNGSTIFKRKCVGCGSTDLRIEPKQFPEDEWIVTCKKCGNQFTIKDIAIVE